jgi:hypothetical protein
MSSWNPMRRKYVPVLPAAAPGAGTLEKPIGKVDGRSARATGRIGQFNPRVHPHFKARFVEAVQEEVARTGRPVSQGHMLEMMLAVWRDARGKASPGGGLALVLPETTMRAAEDLARHLGVPVEQAVGDAIAARMIGAGLAKARPRAALRG